jgi:hypothetical protein
MQKYSLPSALPTTKPQHHENLNSGYAAPDSTYWAQLFKRERDTPPKSKSTMAMSEKLFNISMSLMRPDGLKGPMRMPAMRNPRIIGSA